MDKLTIKKILSDDKLNELADLITSGKVDDLIIIYRDKETDRLDYETNITDWRIMLGELRIAAEIMESDRLQSDGQV